MYVCVCVCVCVCVYILVCICACGDVCMPMCLLSASCVPSCCIHTRARNYPYCFCLAGHPLTHSRSSPTLRFPSSMRHSPLPKPIKHPLAADAPSPRHAMVVTGIPSPPLDASLVGVDGGQRPSSWAPSAHDDRYFSPGLNPQRRNPPNFSSLTHRVSPPKAGEKVRGTETNRNVDDDGRFGSSADGRRSLSEHFGPRSFGSSGANAEKSTSLSLLRGSRTPAASIPTPAATATRSIPIPIPSAARERALAQSASARSKLGSPASWQMVSSLLASSISPSRRASISQASPHHAPGSATSTHSPSSVAIDQAERGFDGSDGGSPFKYRNRILSSAARATRRARGISERSSTGTGSQSPTRSPSQSEKLSSSPSLNQVN
jgi:hypothetical protein